MHLVKFTNNKKRAKVDLNDQAVGLIKAHERSKRLKCTNNKTRESSLVSSAEKSSQIYKCKTNASIKNNVHKNCRFNKAGDTLSIINRHFNIITNKYKKAENKEAVFEKSSSLTRKIESQFCASQERKNINKGINNGNQYMSPKSTNKNKDHAYTLKRSSAVGSYFSNGYEKHNIAKGVCDIRENSAPRSRSYAK